MKERSAEEILEDYISGNHRNKDILKDLDEKETEFFTLIDITNEMFYEKYKKEYNLSEKWDELKPERNEYYKAQEKKFLDIVHLLGLDEEIKLLKLGRSFQFHENDFNFWKDILNNYTKEPLDSLRRGDINGIKDQDRVWICIGIINTFKNAKVSKEKLNLIIKQLDDIFDYRQCLQRIQIEKISYDIKKTIQQLDLELEPNERRLFETDKSVWKLSFVKNYEIFWNLHKKILETMYDIRQREYRESKNKMTAEQRQLLKMGQEIEIEVVNRMEVSEKYKELEEKQDEVFGIKGLREGKKKTPYLKAIEEPGNKLLDDESEYIEKINDQVIKDLYPQFDYQAYMEICEFLYSPKMSATELYEKAKEAVKKELKARQETRNGAKEEGKQ